MVKRGRSRHRHHRRDRGSRHVNSLGRGAGHDHRGRIRDDHPCCSHHLDEPGCRVWCGYGGLYPFPWHRRRPGESGRSVLALGRLVRVSGQLGQVPGREVQALGRQAQVLGQLVPVPGRPVQVPGRPVQVLERLVQVPGQPILYA